MNFARIHRVATVGVAFTCSALLCAQEKKTDDPPRPGREQRQNPPGQPGQQPQQQKQQQAPPPQQAPPQQPAPPQQQAPPQQRHQPPDQRGAQQPPNQPQQQSQPGYQGRPNQSERGQRREGQQNPSSQGQPPQQGQPNVQGQPGRQNPSNQGQPGYQGRPGGRQNEPKQGGQPGQQGQPGAQGQPGGQGQPGYQGRPSGRQSDPNQGGQQGQPGVQGQPGYQGRPGGQPGQQGQPSLQGQPGRQNPNDPNRLPGGARTGNDGNFGRQPNTQQSSRSGEGDQRYQRTVTRTQNGGTVRRDDSGRVREVHTPTGAVIYHRPDGVRRVEVARPGNRVVVTTTAGRGGYVQRSVSYQSRPFVQRTYYSHGATYARVYRPYSFGGVVLHVYTPVRYYRPAFYGWVFNPWPSPIYYRWGWYGRPWYGYYGGYFVPYTAYPGPAFWLTDFLIATTLEAAYQDRLDAAAANAQFAPAPYEGQATLSPEVKQAIADEVRRQLDQERGQSQVISQGGDFNGPPSLLADNNPHVFVVSSPLEVYGQGQSCTLTEGDVLRLSGAVQSNAVAADVVVLASKGTDCRKGSLVSVQLQDLQEMQNQMQAVLDQGLAELQSKQGKEGLPSLPRDAGGSSVFAPFASDITPDTNVVSELNQVAREASQSEQDTVNQATLEPGGTGGPIVISLGQTIEQVTALLGQPQKIVDLGAKTIYVYKDMKITFADRRVSDVQ